MYKVFVNDCPIIMTDNNNISTNLEILDFRKEVVMDIVTQMFENKNKGICFICNDIEECWEAFKSVFEIQEAAGGKVFNNKNQVLFILRFDKWDLPKGKLEKGETIEQCAIREVEEECGISNLSIKKQIETTYHIFQRKDKTILKITYWFYMRTWFNGHLVPQTEEGIEEVVFKNDLEIKEALNNTYENIKLLF